MFFAFIFWQCVNGVDAALDRITPERFLKWTAEVVFDPDTIGEALSDPEGILFGIVFFLMVLGLLVLVKIVVDPFLEVLFGDRGRT